MCDVPYRDHALMARQSSRVFFGLSWVATHSTFGFTQRRVHCRLTSRLVLHPCHQGAVLAPLWTSDLQETRVLVPLAYVAVVHLLTNTKCTDSPNPALENACQSQANCKQEVQLPASI